MKTPQKQVLLPFFVESGNPSMQKHLAFFLIFSGCGWFVSTSSADPTACVNGFESTIELVSPSPLPYQAVKIRATHKNVGAVYSDNYFSGLATIRIPG